MISTKKRLATKIGPDTNDWKWGNVVVTKFDNTPWSYVPQIRPYIDRFIVIPGNGNTNNIAEFGICNKWEGDMQPFSTPKFFAGKTAAYTHITTFEKEYNYENNSFGIPGGLNEFPLQGNFDDMIERHLVGDLWPMKQPKDFEDGLVLTLEPQD